MTRMTGPDCAVMSNLRNTHTHTNTQPQKKCRRDQAFLFRTRHHLSRRGVAFAGTRQLRSQDVVPLHAHRTEGVTGSEWHEGLNGVRSGIGVEGGNGNRNGVGGGDGE